MAEARRTERFIVARDDLGLRLDQLLAARIDGLSRRKARVVLDIGGVFVDGARIKVASRKLRVGQRVVVHLGGALERATKQVGGVARDRDAAELPAFSIEYEDDDVVVVHKPAGLLTAPTPESDRNNLSDLLSRRPGAPPAMVVHRLDLPTSGLLVFARTAEANRALSERFRVHDVQREYLAIVAGAFPDRVTRLDAPVGGRQAVTHVAVEARFTAGATALRCRLETGRTHQIRIHCAGAGHPVLGDPTYGARGAIEPPRMALHAATLGFAHPRTGAPMRFERPWPDDMAAWIETLQRL